MYSAFCIYEGHSESLATGKFGGWDGSIGDHLINVNQY